MSNNKKTELQNKQIPQAIRSPEPTKNETMTKDYTPVDRVTLISIEPEKEGNKTFNGIVSYKKLKP